MPTVLDSNWWSIRDTIRHTFWDDSAHSWVPYEIHNGFGTWPSGSKMERFHSYLYFPDSSIYELKIHAENSLNYYPGYDWYFDDVRIMPDVDFKVKYVLEFSSPYPKNSEVNCLIDFFWENGAGPVLSSPDGSKFRLKVNNEGNLYTEPLR